MNKVLNVYKPIGLSPYQLIQRLRKKLPEYENVKIGFAGRLDPLAHGVMLLMIGDETKNRQLYLDLPKEYEFRTLFGLQTDTYDALGYLKSRVIKPAPKDLEKQIKEFVKEKTGKQAQQYPAYSSKTVNGKPLYWWAKNKKLSQIEIPTREIEVYHLELLYIKNIPKEEIEKIIVANINSVNGDFRQVETLKKWGKFFETKKQELFITAGFRIRCSSGTYVRSIINDLGDTLGTGAIALEILRTKAGAYTPDGSIIL